MTRRFSRIKEASRLSSAVDDYVQWIQDAATRPRRIGQGTAKPPQIMLAIRPFTTSLDADDPLFLAFAGEPSRALMGTAIGTAAQEVGGAVEAMRVSGWSPARITLFAGTGTSTVATSQITGLQYLKYSGQSYSHPFGRGTATDTEFELFAEIKSALVAAGSNRRVSLRSESYRQI